MGNKPVRKRGRLLKSDKKIGFPWKDKVFRAEVVKVTDGDTIKVKFKRFTDVWVVSLRIYGIDTPETRRSKTELEGRAGKCLTEFVKSMMVKKVKVRFHNWDAFGGRYLAELYVKGESLGDVLLRKRYAKPYFGGRKLSWSEEELQGIIDEIEQDV